MHDSVATIYFLLLNLSGSEVMDAVLETILCYSVVGGHELLKLQRTVLKHLHADTVY